MDIKEFWEWCGFTTDGKNWYEWGKEHHCWNIYWENYSGTPTIDLNNLFKYAAPKLRYCHITKIDTLSRNVEYLASARYGEGVVGNEGYGRGVDPAQALYKAICGVIKNELE